MKTVCCSILGFGAIGQGVAEVLLMKKEYLRSIGLEVKVVAVADSKGATVDPEGVNLADCLARKRTSGTVALESITGIEVISSVDHKLVIETTPTNIKTGGAGLQNMLAALDGKGCYYFQQRASHPKVQGTHGNCKGSRIEFQV